MLQHDALASGRFKRVPERWQTEFGRWVGEYGVGNIVAALDAYPDLRVTQQAIYQWLGGHAPHPTRALALVQLSGNALSLSSIYEHCRIVRGLPSLPAPHGPSRNPGLIRVESRAARIARGLGS